MWPMLHQNQFKPMDTSEFQGAASANVAKSDSELLSWVKILLPWQDMDEMNTRYVMVCLRHYYFTVTTVRSKQGKNGQDMLGQ